MLANCIEIPPEAIHFGIEIDACLLDAHQRDAALDLNDLALRGVVAGERANVAPAGNRLGMGSDIRSYPAPHGIKGLAEPDDEVQRIILKGVEFVVGLLRLPLYFRWAH